MKYPVWVQTKTHRKMHDDFKVFLWWLWKQLGLPAPTPAQYEMADWLQYGPRRRIVMAFRGVGKSWITAAFVLWCLMRDPQEKQFCNSTRRDSSISAPLLVHEIRCRDLKTRN